MSDAEKVRWPRIWRMVGRLLSLVMFALGFVAGAQHHYDEGTYDLALSVLIEVGMIDDLLKRRRLTITGLPFGSTFMVSEGESDE